MDAVHVEHDEAPPRNNLAIEVDITARFGSEEWRERRETPDFLDKAVGSGRVLAHRPP